MWHLQFAPVRDANYVLTSHAPGVAPFFAGLTARTQTFKPISTCLQSLFKSVAKGSITLPVILLLFTGHYVWGWQESNTGLLGGDAELAPLHWMWVKEAQG